MFDAGKVKGFLATLDIYVIFPVADKRGDDLHVINAANAHSFFATARTVDFGISSMSSLCAMEKIYHTCRLLVTMERSAL